MTKEQTAVKNKSTVFLMLAGIYVVLFEFILPINKVLPKPSIFLESFIHIWFDYNLLSAFTVTATVVYISMLFGFVQIFIGMSNYLKIFSLMEGSVISLRFFSYLTPFFFLIIFNFWFPDYLAGEFLFAFLVASFWILRTLFEESKKVKEEYLLTARNLELKQSEIIEKVYWKSALPGIFTNLRSVNIQLWLLILMYEFIGNYNGAGYIYRLAFTYKDFTALFTLALLCAVLIFIGDYLIKQIQNKFVNWTA
ncbi:MAG: ABC transporter permease subunit [Melioribacteraceae bacterium]